jgi:pimeloyl-ACP methyl ester carboxylesterase
MCRVLFLTLVSISAATLVTAQGISDVSRLKTLTVNGYRMAYFDVGTGPTVVLVHGALSDYRYWTPQMNSLSRQFRIIALSLRHYYPERWDGKGTEFSVKQHTADVVAFVSQLNTGLVHLVGHSRGGRVAFGVALARPDLIRKLVLMEPNLYSLAPPASPPGMDPRAARIKRTAARFEQGDIDGGLEVYLDDIEGAGFWRRITEDERQRFRDNAWTAVGEMTPPPAVACSDVAGLRVPVLLVGGQNSPRGLGRNMDETQKCLPSAQRVTIGDAGHAMSLVNPTAFDAALVKFLLE